MSLASFAFSAAKPLWLCINISLHPIFSEITWLFRYLTNARKRRDSGVIR